MIDSRDKRASAVLPGSPWRCMLPAPDGAALSAEDRAQTANQYAFVSVVVNVGGVDSQRMRRTLMAHELLRIARPEWFGPEEDLYRMRR